MQYTAKKPYYSVLIVHPEGVRHRLQEDHVFKDIRYNQITSVKIKRDVFLLIFGYILGPLQLLFFIYLSIFEGLDLLYGIELAFWIGYVLAFLLIPFHTTLVISKGSIVIEAFKTTTLGQVNQIKKEIESHL